MASTRSVEPAISGQGPLNSDAQVPESVWTNAFWHSPLRTSYDHHKLLFTLRCFENVSTVFGPNWHRMATQSGKYRAFDMNMPYTIPALKFSNCQYDPPLSVFGKFSAQTLARSLRNQLFKISVIVSAPSLRCVQTACAFAEIMETQVYVLEELREPEIIKENGCLTTAYGKYLTIDELRACGYKVQGLKLDDDIPSSNTDSDLAIMARIGKTLREVTTKIKPGPMLIVGDALVLKIANSMAALPEGYSDPLHATPFIVPAVDSNEDIIEMDRYDFTQLPDHFPHGTLNVYNREIKEGTVMRIPYSMPKITIVPGKEGKEKERELKADKPENSLQLQKSRDAIETNQGSGSEISI